MEPYYADDNVTLYLGDCREVTEWLAADVLVTDPPYGIAYQAGTMPGGRASLTEQVTIASDRSPVARDEALALWGDRPALVFGSWRIPRPPGVANRLIWHKTQTEAGARRLPWFSAEEEIYQIGQGFSGDPEQNVLATSELRSGAHGQAARIGHPTPKPVSLMVRLISKCPPGVIADPFSGSGATLIAARDIGRSAIGVEIDERYCEIAARRLSQGLRERVVNIWIEWALLYGPDTQAHGQVFDSRKQDTEPDWAAIYLPSVLALMRPATRAVRANDWLPYASGSTETTGN